MAANSCEALGIAENCWMLWMANGWASQCKLLPESLHVSCAPSTSFRYLFVLRTDVSFGSVETVTMPMIHGQILLVRNMVGHSQFLGARTLRVQLSILREKVCFKNEALHWTCFFQDGTCVRQESAPNRSHDQVGYVETTAQFTYMLRQKRQPAVLQDLFCCRRNSIGHILWTLCNWLRSIDWFRFIRASKQSSCMWPILSQVLWLWGHACTCRCSSKLDKASIVPLRSKGEWQCWQAYKPHLEKDMLNMQILCEVIQHSQGVGNVQKLNRIMPLYPFIILYFFQLPLHSSTTWSHNWPANNAR